MTRRVPKAPARALFAVGAATVASVSLSGCAYLSPAQTEVSYDPGDGAQTKIGDISLDNVLVVTSAKDAEGKVDGMVTNNGQQTVKVQVTPAGGTATTITVPAQTAVRLDGSASGDSTDKISPVTISKVGVEPGKYTKITFATGGAGQVDLPVPVLLDQPPYGSASPEHAEAAPSAAAH